MVPVGSQVMEPNWRSILDLRMQAVMEQAAIALCMIAVIPGCCVLFNNKLYCTDQRFWLKLTGARMLESIDLYNSPAIKNGISTIA